MPSRETFSRRSARSLLPSPCLRPCAGQTVSPALIAAVLTSAVTEATRAVASGPVSLQGDGVPAYLLAHHRHTAVS
jgi:hypothetical protein